MTAAEVLRADLALLRAALDNGVLIRGEIAYSVAAVCEWVESQLKEQDVSSGNKYHRQICGLRAYHGTGALGTSVMVDVYSVLTAFAVECPGLQHAAKKILCAGIRGKASKAQDLREARDALDRAIEDAEREEQQAKEAA